MPLCPEYLAEFLTQELLDGISGDDTKVTETQASRSRMLRSRETQGLSRDLGRQVQQRAHPDPVDTEKEGPGKAGKRMTHLQRHMAEEEENATQQFLDLSLCGGMNVPAPGELGGDENPELRPPCQARSSHQGAFDSEKHS